MEFQKTKPLFIKKFIKDFILRSDMFAAQPTLRYGGQSSYETSYGGCLSILMVVGFAAIFYTSFINVLRKVNVTASTDVQVLPVYYTGWPLWDRNYYQHRIGYWHRWAGLHRCAKILWDSIGNINCWIWCGNCGWSEPGALLKIYLVILRLYSRKLIWCLWDGRNAMPHFYILTHFARVLSKCRLEEIRG